MNICKGVVPGTAGLLCKLKTVSKNSQPWTLYIEIWETFFWYALIFYKMHKYHNMFHLESDAGKKDFIVMRNNSKFRL